MRQRFRPISLISLLIALIACACVGPHTPLDANNLHRTIYIENTFSPQEEDNIENAAHSWECATGGMVHFTFVRHFSIYNYVFIRDPRHAIVFVHSNSNASVIRRSDKTLPQDPDIMRATLGLFVEGHGAIPDQIFLVENMLSPNTYQPVATHELGHALGMAHNKNTNSIMYPHIDQGKTFITSNDLTEFCSIYNCRNAYTHPCNE